MTSFDFLPREEPGRPLYRLPPDFLDRLMDEYRRVERRRKAKRASTILTIGLCAIGLTYGHFRSYSPAVHYEIPVAKAKPRPVPVQVTAPLPEPPRVAQVPRRPKAVPKAKAPAKSEKVPVLEASPGLIHLCDEFQPASQKEGTVPCVSAGDPLEPHNVYKAPPYRKPLPQSPPQKP